MIFNCLKKIEKFLFLEYYFIKGFIFLFFKNVDFLIDNFVFCQKDFWKLNFIFYIKNIYVVIFRKFELVYKIE